MGKNIARRAAGEVVKGSSATGWVVVIITAIAIVIAWNPYGHVHHWTIALIIFIAGITLAAIADRTTGRGRRR